LNESLLLVKQHYDAVLQSGTCLTLMGKNPKKFIKLIPAYELFSGYFEFLGSGLCTETTDIDIQNMFKNQQESSNFYKADSLNQIQKNILTPKMFGSEKKNS
jgi:hypothetical protein